MKFVNNIQQTDNTVTLTELSLDASIEIPKNKVIAKRKPKPQTQATYN